MGRGSANDHAPEREGRLKRFLSWVEVPAATGVGVAAITQLLLATSAVGAKTWKSDLIASLLAIIAIGISVYTKWQNEKGPD